MTKDVFGEQLNRLKNTYGEKIFPDERVKMMWKKYENKFDYEFSLAVDMVVLRMPGPTQLIDFLDEQMRNNSFSGRGDGKKLGEEYPINPKAKELADYYIPLIKADIRKFMNKILPYDTNERIESEEIPF